jgi:hypothetical protein
MGQLSADRKGDYDYALECHSQALKIQEQVELLVLPTAEFYV